LAKFSHKANFDKTKNVNVEKLKIGDNTVSYGKVTKIGVKPGFVKLHFDSQHVMIVAHGVSLHVWQSSS
jgi:hypothetical protein